MKNILKKIVAIAMIVATVTAIVVVPAAAATYKLELNQMTDQQMQEAQVSILFDIQGNDDYIKVVGNPEYGYPVLLNSKALGGGITLIPLKLVCNSLGIPLDWDNTKKCAVLKTSKYGDVELYNGATSVKSADGSMTYTEDRYKFPDGSLVPIVTMRQGRTYVPVMFMAKFILGEVSYSWSQNMNELTITAVSDYNTFWDGVGVYDDVELVPGDPFANMPNTKAIYDELGCTHDSPTGNSITINGSKLQLFEGEGFEIKGFTTAPDDDPTTSKSIRWRVQQAYIKDLLDKESADAVIKWLDEMARLCMISVDTGLEYGFGSPEDEAAYKIYSDYVTPAFEGETKIGNVIMYFNCTSTGAPMDIGFKNP